MSIKRKIFGWVLASAVSASSLSAVVAVEADCREVQVTAYNSASVAPGEDRSLFDKDLSNAQVLAHLDLVSSQTQILNLSCNNIELNKEFVTQLAAGLWSRNIYPQSICFDKAALHARVSRLSPWKGYVTPPAFYALQRLKLMGIEPAFEQTTEVTLERWVENRWNVAHQSFN